MKQLIITETPERLVNILNGNATLLLKKYIPKGFNGWVNVCCGKGKPYLRMISNYGWQHKEQYSFELTYNKDFWDILNSKVVCRFWFDEWEEIIRTDYFRADGDTGFIPMMKSNGETYNERIIIRFRENYEYDECKESGLTTEQLKSYGKGKDLYAWHIKQLKIFDKPKELGEFMNYYRKEKIDYEPLTHAPQKYAYVWTKEE